MCTCVGLGGFSSEKLLADAEVQIHMPHVPFQQILHSSSSVPAVVLDHVGQLNNELALLVLLTALKGMLIFPAQRGFAIFTVNVGHSV